MKNLGVGIFVETKFYRKPHLSQASRFPYGGNMINFQQSQITNSKIQHKISINYGIVEFAYLSVLPEFCDNFQGGYLFMKGSVQVRVRSRLDHISGCTFCTRVNLQTQSELVQ